MTQIAAIPGMDSSDMFSLLNFASYSPPVANAASQAPAGFRWRRTMKRSATAERLRSASSRDRGT